MRKPRDFSHFPPACRTTIRNFVRWLPKFPGCADNPKFGSQQRPRGNWYEHKPSDQRVAIEYPLIQYNYKRVWHWLGFDLDYAVKTAPRFPWVAENELNLPVPHLVMVNPSNGHAHALWMLATPVLLGEACSDRLRGYLRDTNITLGYKLGADVDYGRFLCKNPLHTAWEVITPPDAPPGGYELAKLYQNGCLYTAMNSRPAASVGRNYTLFTKLREWARGQHSDDLHSWLRHIGARATLLNERFSERTGNEPLPLREVAKVSTRVGEWMWQHRLSNQHLNPPTNAVGRDDKLERGWQAIKTCYQQLGGSAIPRHQVGELLYEHKPTIAALLGNKSFPVWLSPMLLDSATVVALVNNRPLPPRLTTPRHQRWSSRAQRPPLPTVTQVTTTKPTHPSGGDGGDLVCHV